MPAPRTAIGRLAALPPASSAASGRIAIAHEDRLILAEDAAGQAAGLRVGDLVRFALDADGGLALLEPLRSPHSTPTDAGRDPEDAGDAWRWRRPGARHSRMGRLRLRHRVLAAVRDWFAAQGFLEIDTPCLARAPSPEPQFQPIAAGEDYLVTSPEFQLKRLLVGGFERIYRLGPVFRGGESGRRHNPEFTLLEWYRVGAGLEELARDVEDLVRAVLPLAETLTADGQLRLPADPFLESGAGTLLVDPRPPFRRASVADILREELGVDLAGVTDLPALRRSVAGSPHAEGLPEDFERAFFALWSRVEPRLGHPAPLLVVDWPAPLASLARLKPADPTVAERMECYVGGVELANGFAELTDPAEQRRRFEADLAARRAQGLEPLPLDERFLAALAEGMPPAAGMALGFDRLLMLLAGTDEIRDVLPFAWDER